MNGQLQNVISELEQYHVNPHEIDFEDSFPRKAKGKSW